MKLYDDPALALDPEYAPARCGLVVHVDDLAEHGTRRDPCELCDELEGQP